MGGIQTAPDDIAGTGRLYKMKNINHYHNKLSRPKCCIFQISLNFLSRSTYFKGFMKIRTVPRLALNVFRMLLRETTTLNT